MMDNDGKTFSKQILAMFGVALVAGFYMSLCNPLITVYLEEHDAGTVMISVLSTTYFVTVALVSLFAASLIKRIGKGATIRVGLYFISVATPLFLLTEALPLWFLLRIAMAIGFALILVGGQTRLNQLNNESNRAMTNGLYAMSMTLGYGFGPFLGTSFYTQSPELTFVGCSVLTMLGVFLVLSKDPETNQAALPQTANVDKWSLYKQISWPVHIAFCHGFFQATLFTMFPVFFLRLHDNVEDMGLVMLFMMVATLPSVLLMSYLADRANKLVILSICISVGLVALSGIAFSTDFNSILMFGIMGGIGLGPVFPLAVSILTERIDGELRTVGMGLTVSMVNMGSAIGPFATALVMEQFGDSYVFALTCALFVFVLLQGVIKPKSSIQYEPEVSAR